MGLLLSVLVVLALLPAAWRGADLVIWLLVILWANRHATAYLGFDPLGAFGQWFWQNATN